MQKTTESLHQDSVPPKMEGGQVTEGKGGKVGTQLY
jgi:hypothetical protein